MQPAPVGPGGGRIERGEGRAGEKSRVDDAAIRRNLGCGRGGEWLGLGQCLLAAPGFKSGRAVGVLGCRLVGGMRTAAGRPAFPRGGRLGVAARVFWGAGTHASAAAARGRAEEAETDGLDRAVGALALEMRQPGDQRHDRRQPAESSPGDPEGVHRPPCLSAHALQLTLLYSFGPAVIRAETPISRGRTRRAPSPAKPAQAVPHAHAAGLRSSHRSWNGVPNEPPRR
jgi:hypothetical protein